MIYGHAKVRTMQRSILPSSARKGARDNKRNLVKSNRRPIRAALNSYYGDWDDNEANLTYWEGPNRHEYGEIIFTRRDHDKLAHFEMWAYKRTRHIRVEDRLSKMSGLLPKGVIGTHALSHLSFLDYRTKILYDGRHWTSDGLPSQLRTYPHFKGTLVAASIPVAKPGEVVEVRLLRR